LIFFSDAFQLERCRVDDTCPSSRLSGYKCWPTGNVTGEAKYRLGFSHCSSKHPLTFTRSALEVVYCEYVNQGVDVSNRPIRLIFVHDHPPTAHAHSGYWVQAVIRPS